MRMKPKADGKSAEYKLESMTLSNDNNRISASPTSIKAENTGNDTKVQLKLLKIVYL